MTRPGASPLPGDLRPSSHMPLPPHVTTSPLLRNAIACRVPNAIVGRSVCAWDARGHNSTLIVTRTTRSSECSARARLVIVCSCGSVTLLHLVERHTKPPDYNGRELVAVG